MVLEKNHDQLGINWEPILIIQGKFRHSRLGQVQNNSYVPFVFIKVRPTILS